MRILLVEDEPRIAEAMRRVLAAEHYSVDVAGDGLDALELADQATFDVIILDRLLPRLDGVGVLQEVRTLIHRHEQAWMSALSTDELRGYIELLHRIQDSVTESSG